MTKSKDWNDLHKEGKLTADMVLNGGAEMFADEAPKPPALKFTADQYEKADFEAMIERVEAAASVSGDATEKSAPVVDWLANPASLEILAKRYMGDSGYVESLLLRLEAVRGMKNSAGQIRGEIKRRRKEMESEARRQKREGLNLRIAKENDQMAPLGEVLGHDLPELYAPEGWIVNDSGIFKLVDTQDGIQQIHVSKEPILISGIVSDLETGNEALHIEWRKNEIWKSEIIKSSITQDTKAFIHTRDRGSPVALHNAKDLAQFVTEFESGNDLPRCFSTKKLGWLKIGDERVFLCGQTLITSEGTRQTNSLPPSQWRQDWVHADLDTGMDQYIKGMTKKGTFDGWKQMVEEDLLNHPVAMVALYASLCSPFLGIIEKAPNPIVDFSSETSHGKTTIMRAAISAWGLPSDDGRLMQSWSMTTVALERIAELYHHLPLVLDDTKRADNPEHIPGFVYQLANGIGRARGNIDGLRRTAQIRCAVLSTGEAPLTSFGTNAGAKARILAVQQLPFGKGNQHDLVYRIQARAHENYGHAGPRLISILAKNQSKWHELVMHYEMLRDQWAKLMKSGQASRAAESIALLELGKIALHQYLGVKAPKEDPLAVIFDVHSQTNAIDTQRIAFEDAISWVRANAEKFRSERSTDREPPQGWAGYWCMDVPDLKDVHFYPQVLRKIMKDMGYNLNDLLSAWKNRGWLICEDGRYDVKLSRKIDPLRQRVYKIPFSALSFGDDASENTSTEVPF